MGDIWPLDKVDQLIAEIEEDEKEIEKYWAKVDPKMSKEEFTRMMEFLEQLGQKAARLGYLPYLMAAVEQNNQRARALKGRADEVELELAERTRKIYHWIKGIRGKQSGKEIAASPESFRGPRNDETKLDDKNARRLFGAVPDLEYSLNYMRQAAKHSLTEEEENIISHKDSNGVGVLVELRDLIETEFRYEVKIGGKKKKVNTQAQLLAMTHSPRREEREAAYKALLTKQKENLDKFFLVYRAAAKDWDYEAKLRGYKSPIGMRNFGNHVPDEAVEALLEVCTEKRGVFQEYFGLKAKEVGVKQLSRLDIYAPITAKKTKFSYKEAKEMVMEAFGEFSDRFRNAAEEMWQKKHIDLLPREDKRGGAFCATVGPKIAPYIMLNHTGKLRDVYTMAHELGHGVHSLYAASHHYSVQQADLPLAETASTLGEMILFEKIYQKEKDIKTKRAMLFGKMDDAYATILRQNYFVLFEIEAHKRMAEGLTGVDLGKMWLKGLREEFGESVTVDPLFANEWSYIPHIVHTPFYCYAYSFGQLLSLSLYKRYKDEGKNFVPQMETILEAGGSRSPAEILAKLGIDMKDKDFWRQGFEVIEGWLDELKLKTK